MLLEMLVVIGIVMVALIIQAQVFRASMRQISQAPDVERQLLGINQVQNTLRQDVWGASGIAVIDPSSVTLTYPDGHSVGWVFAAGKVTRTDSRDAAALVAQRQWSIESSLHLSRDGNDLVLRGVSDREQSLVPQRRFVSQVMRAAQGRQS
jgi:hypothetical protein